MGFCPQLNMTLNKNYNSKKEARSGSFCVVNCPSQINPSKRSKLSDMKLITVGRNKTKTIIVSFIPELSFLLRSSIGSSIISTFFLMHTFTGFWQCGQRVTNIASELKTASRKITFVQWGQLPTFDSSLSILFLFLRRLIKLPPSWLVDKRLKFGFDHARV